MITHEHPPHLLGGNTRGHKALGQPHCPNEHDCCLEIKLSTRSNYKSAPQC